MEKSWEWDIEKDKMFVDMMKAFSRVSSKRLWDIMKNKKKYRITSKLHRAIKSIYSRCENKVKLKGDEAAWFEVKTGVRQRGVLSPLLFSIFMDYAMEEIAGDNEEIILAYADDVAVISDSERSLQAMAQKWNSKMNENGMEVNSKKTEVMELSIDNERLSVSIGGEPLKQVRNFQYLGVQINAENRQDDEEYITEPTNTCISIT